MSGLGNFLGKAGGAASSQGMSNLLGPFGGFVGQSANKLWPVQTWSPGDLINALAQQQIRHDWFQEQMARQGFNVLTVSPDKLNEVVLRGDVLDWNSDLSLTVNFQSGLIRSLMASPSIDQAFTLYNRGQITRNLLDRWIQRQGFYEFQTRNQLISLANQIPDPNELIDFGQSGLFYGGLVQHFGLQNEFPEAMRPWIKANGLDWPINIARPGGVDANGQDTAPGIATWADLKWWNHWRDPGLTDVYTMYQRLYADSPFGASPLVPYAGTITEQDVRVVLSRQSIPRYWRNAAIAISYVPFNKREIQRLFNYEVASEADVYHTMRFNGYSDANAQQQVQLARLLKREFDRRQKFKLSASQICQLYQTGVLGNEDAMEKLLDLEYSTDEATAILANCDLEWQKKLVNKSLRYIKDAFLYGVINEDGVRFEFIKLGVAGPRVNQYINLWKMERDSRFKEARTSDILKWYELGIINAAETLSRLTTLGYLLMDAQKMMIVIELKVTEEQTKALAARNRAIEKELNREQRAKEKESKILVKEQKERIKALLVASTQANLKQWLKDGLITDDEATARLKLKEWPDEDIKRFLEEAHKPAKAKGKPNASKKTPASETPSGGSSPGQAPMP